MTQQSAGFVGSIPEHYDKYLGPRIFDRYAQDLAARVVASAPDTVLELAAGTGIVSRCLRDALPVDSSLVASDLNPPMLEVARRKFEAGEDVRFEALDATSLPYGDATFDAVACQFGVMFFPDKQRSYEEVLRVLKPCGQYVFNVWGSWEDNAFAQVAHEAVAAFFPDDPPGFYRVPFGYHDPVMIEQALLKAGFSSVAIKPVSFCSAIKSAQEFASGLVYGNPLFDEILARGGDPKEIRLAVASAIEERLGDSMSLAALVIEASKS
jgi:SAM-dependent methyltransferase